MKNNSMLFVEIIGLGFDCSLFNVLTYTIYMYILCDNIFHFILLYYCFIFTCKG